MARSYAPYVSGLVVAGALGACSAEIETTPRGEPTEAAAPSSTAVPAPDTGNRGPNSPACHAARAGEAHATAAYSLALSSGNPKKIEGTREGMAFQRKLSGFVCSQ